MGAAQRSFRQGSGAMLEVKMVSRCWRVFCVSQAHDPPGHDRLSIVPPVLVEDYGHVGQLSYGRFGQQGGPDGNHDLKLMSDAWCKLPGGTPTAPGRGQWLSASS